MNNEISNKAQSRTFERAEALQTPRVLVICNRADTAALWGYLLREKGLAVALEAALDNAVERWSAELPDLVVLDVDAEHRNLLEILKTLRGFSSAPILLFIPTHHETLILDAYAAGVDDVIVKPIGPAVFQAKILAWARRSWTVPMEGLGLVRAGRYRLDPARRCLIDVNDTEIKLTNLEFHLLHLLMRRPGEVCTGDDLIKAIWGGYGNGDHILLKNVIYRLRKKIEADPSHPVHLITWPGGYSYHG